MLSYSIYSSEVGCDEFKKDARENTMRKLFFSLALSLIVLSVNISAQVLDKDTDAATKKLFHPDLIGVELKLQGEYVGKDGKNGKKQVGVQVVAAA